MNLSIFVIINKDNMTAIHPQYITDNTGKKISVILPLKEFDAIMEELEELEDIRLFDEAKKEDDGTRILFSDYLKNRNTKNT
ncbi:hypothetical protein [Emticicia sp.]|uniref:hypothetical protein n=1 Tax=Emticicia sp. TaxID=1930953 RepID=UPI003BAAC0D0